MKERKVSLGMNKKVEEWSALLMQFLLYHCLACTAMAAIYETEQPLYYMRMLLLFVPLCYLALVRTYIRQFALFMLLHVPVLLMSVLMRQNMGEETVVLVCTVIMLVSSIHAGTVRKNKPVEKYRVTACPHLVLVLVLLFCHYVGYYLKHPLLVTISSYELQIYIVLYLVHESMANTLDFIHLHRDTANFPVGQMTIIYRLMVVLFLAGVVLAMVIFPKLHLEVILSPILKGMLALLSWLLSFIKLPEASEQVEQAAQQMGNASLQGLVENTETSVFWLVAEQIMKLMVGIALVALIVGGIGYILYYLYKGFYSEKKENTDEKEFLVDEMKWFSKDWFGSFRKEKDEHGTVNQRVRKVYRRYVKKNFKRKETVPEAMTPDELLIFLREKAGGLSEAERCKARTIYEKARYGHPECSADELEEMKRLLTRS